MRNIILFLRRYVTVLLFVVLQGIALWMLFNYNRYHRTVFTGLASEVTGSVNKQVDQLDDYFHQGQENIRVHRMNDSLMNLLRANYLLPDTASRFVTDSVRKDSAIGLRRYVWRDAKVVYNTVTFDKNYLQLDRGSNGGIRPDMAVLSSTGAVVGIVVGVSPNFSHVMSLLHTQNSVSASLKRTGEGGRVEWDRKDPRFLQLRGIPANVQLRFGDTVVTSRFSYNFPPNYVIGTVAKVTADPATGFYIIQVRTAANFASLQQVFVVENLQRDEQINLAREAEQRLEQQNKNQR